MHVNLNCFDYQKLLDGIVTHYDLADEVLSSEWVARVFTDLSEKFKRNNSGQLSPDEIKMVEHFLGLTISYIILEDEEDSPPIDEQINNGLSILGDEIEDCVDDTYSRFIELFVGQYITPSADPNPEEVQAFIGHFSEVIEIYLKMKSIPDFTPGELFILGEIEKATHPCEVVVDIDIINHPAKMIKYGDTLITFPIILIEVTDVK